MWSWFAAVAWWRRKEVEFRGARRRVTSRATGTPMTTLTRVSSHRRPSSLSTAGRCWSQKAWCPAALTYPLPLLDRGVMSSDNKLPPAMLQQNCFTTITGVDFQQWKQPNFFLKTTFPLFSVWAAGQRITSTYLLSGWVATKQANEWRMHVYISMAVRNSGTM